MSSTPMTSPQQPSDALAPNVWSRSSSSKTVSFWGRRRPR